MVNSKIYADDDLKWDSEQSPNTGNFAGVDIDNIISSVGYAWRRSMCRHNNGNIYYVTINSSRELLLNISTDGGDNWTSKIIVELSSCTNQYFYGLALDHSGNIFVAFCYATGCGDVETSHLVLEVSEDEGDTWLGFGVNPYPGIEIHEGLIAHTWDASYGGLVLTMDPDDLLYIAYNYGTGVNAKVSYRTYEHSTTTLSSEEDVSFPGTPDPNYYIVEDMESDADGNIFLIFTLFDTINSYYPYIMKFPDGNPSQMAQSFNPLFVKTSSISIGDSPDNYIHVVLSKLPDFGNYTEQGVVLYNRLTYNTETDTFSYLYFQDVDALPWDDQVVINSTTGNYMVLAVNQSGEVDLLWEYTDGNYNIYHNRRDSDGNWELANTAIGTSGDRYPVIVHHQFPVTE